ncbi:MAG: alpha/beta fold hydrolase [Bacteroidota bacterium]
MKFKKRHAFLSILLVIGFGFALGPRVSYPAFDDQPVELQVDLQDLDAYLAKREARVEKLKPNNQAQIIWNDSIRKTPYSIVYIHGFSASPMEGDPVHLEIAKRYGCNLYLPRLAGHGIDDIESFKDLTPKALIESAKEALAIGAMIGEKVILMSCSTGSTLSVYLAATQAQEIHSMIMYSPNIDLYSGLSNLLTGPWGLEIAQQVSGGNYRSFEAPPGGEQYWTTKYRIEGIVCLRDLLDKTMTPDNFAKITQPYFLGYYYKTEEESDHVISIDAIKSFHAQTRTPEAQKVLQAFPNVANHVLPSSIQSKDIASVREKTIAFMEQVLSMTPAAPPLPISEEAAPAELEAAN